MAIYLSFGHSQLSVIFVSQTVLEISCKKFGVGLTHTIFGSICYQLNFIADEHLAKWNASENVIMQWRVMV